MADIDNSGRSTANPLRLIPRYIGRAMVPSFSYQAYTWSLNPVWQEEYTKQGLDERVSTNTYVDNLNELNTLINQKASSDDLNAVNRKAAQTDSTLTDFLRPNTGRHDRDVAAAKAEATKKISDLEERVVKLKFSKMITTFGNNGIELSGTEKFMKLRITNDRLEFVENDVVTAYITGKKFHIANGAVTDSFQVGQHLFQRYNANHTVVRWVKS